MMKFVAAHFCILLAIITKGIEGATFDFSENFTSNTQQPNIGESVTLPCDVQTVPTDVIGWTKDGINIDETNLTFTLVDDNSLHIQSYSSEYNGFYHCIAQYKNTTNAVQILASPPILLSSYESRIFTMHPKNHTARLKVAEEVMYEAIVFECTLVKVFRGPAPIITWQIVESNGDVNNITDFADDNSGKDVIIQHDHTGYYQRHNPTMADDDGLTVRCVATNSENIDEVVYSNWASANITAEIAVPDSDNAFTMKPPGIVYADPATDEYIVLPCAISDGRQGNEFLVAWYYDIVPLFTDGRADAPQFTDIILFGETNLRLKVSFVQSVPLTGKFICRTRIAGGDESAITRIILDQEPPLTPAPVVSVQKLEEVTDLMSTKNVSFTGGTQSTVIAIRSWLNGMLLKNSDKYEIEMSADTVLLSIMDMAIGDTGVYQIEVISGTVYDFSVGVYIVDLKARVPIDISPVCTSPVAIVPTVATPYVCSPSISFGQLQSSGELIFNNNIDQSVEGNYHCSSESIQFILQINVIIPIIINKPSNDTIAATGAQITLQCATTNYPVIQQYQWTKDDQIIQQTADSTYTIDAISVDDIGIYECLPVSNNQCTPEATILQVDVKLPVINISPLIEYNETIAPFAPSGYNCTPPLPDNGELNEFGELLIKSGVDETANGEYVCMSEDINGSLYFDLIVKAKAYVVNSTEDSIAEIGSSITLQCIAIGIPNTVEYQWKKNGVLLSQETTQNLVIANISLTDIGEYECIPSNDEGTYNTSVIQLDIRIPTIVNVLLEQILITTLPSSSDNYTCSPEIPNGYITDTGTLVITTSQLNSSANMEYECSSNVSNGKFIIDLTVAAPAYITDAITSAVDVDTGANISLWCNANGIPNTIEFQWKKDGNVLPNVNTYTYTINSMSLADIGSYECIPSNVIGTHNTSMIRVNINVGVRLSGLIRNSIPVAPVSNTGYTCSPFLPVGVLLTNSGILISFKGVTGSINNKYYCTSPELGGTVIIDLTVAEPARIVSLTKDFIADVGTNKSIVCIAYGSPNTISYIWKKNGNIVTGANTAILSINDVSVDDIGEYECIPSNSQGTQNTAKTQVDVKINIDVNGLSSQERNILPPVTSGYSCTPPLPKGELNSQGKLLLDIGLTDSDSNEHQCSSDDINGTFVLNLNVYAAAYIACSSDNMESDVGEQVTFECSAKGIPNNITFVWKKDGQVIVGEVDSTYTIRSVSILDSGRYECIPFNSYGYHNSSTMELKVKETEKFDWLTSYFLQEKFPPTGSSAGYLCLPSFSSRLRITSEGHFITDGLYLEDEGTYICSSVTIQVSFVFHILVQGYVPNAVVLNKPSFTDNGLAIYLNWSLNATRLQPVDRYLLVWRLSDDSKRSEQTIITTNNSYTFYNYSEEATYVFRIIAQNEVGLSSPSNEQEFNIRVAISGIERDTPDDGGGIEVWMIVLIVISGLILLLICCICCFVCLFCFFGSRKKVYHAEKEEAKNVEELERYRKKGEAESDESDFSNSDNHDDCSITGDNES